MQKLRQIIRLYCQGTEIKTIHGMIDTSRNTIKKYIRIWEGLNISHESFSQKSDAELATLFSAFVSKPVDNDRQANFRYNASLEQIDFSIDRGLDKNEVHRLAFLEFVGEHKDLFIAGSTGTGKSYLATTLGYQACQQGYRVMYVNTAKLMGQLKLAKAKGTVLSDLKRIERMDVLILTVNIGRKLSRVLAK